MAEVKAVPYQKDPEVFRHRLWAKLARKGENVHFHRSKFYILAGTLIGLGFGEGLGWGWWSIIPVFASGLYAYLFEWDLTFRREPTRMYGSRPEHAVAPRRRYHPLVAACLLVILMAMYSNYGSGFSAGGVVFALGCFCALVAELIHLGTDPSPQSLSY